MASEVESFDYDVLGEPVFTCPTTGDQFFQSLTLNSDIISRGDCVMVEVDIDEGDGNDDDDDGDDGAGRKKSKSNGYEKEEEEENHRRGREGSTMLECAQILAIYLEAASQDVFVEVRWFLQTEEVLASMPSIRNKRQRVEFEEDEIVESDTLDIITAGSLRSKVVVCFEDSDLEQTQSSFRVYLCRRMRGGDSASLLPVDGRSFLQRGFSYSDFKEHYNNKGSSNNNSLENKYLLALQRLHVSSVPAHLPCRESEIAQLREQLSAAIAGHGSNQPIYISGMPGTGKTATVHSVVQSMLREAAAGGNNNNNNNSFQFVEINCLRLQSPQDAYSVFWRQLSGQHLSSKAALNRLNNFYSNQFTTIFTNNNNNNNNKNAVNNNKHTILLLDEVDFLTSNNHNNNSNNNNYNSSNSNSSVLYSFFEWPLSATARLTVVAISNIMDLPERLAARVQSRLGPNLVRIVFKPYNHEQIRLILQERLSEAPLSTLLDASAIELISRSFSKIVGDLRAALKICQRTIQLFCERKKKRQALNNNNNSSSNSSSSGSSSSSSNDNDSDESITLDVVSLAIAEYNRSPMQVCVRSCCQLDQAVVVCLLRHQRFSGSNEITATQLWQRLSDLLLLVAQQQALQPKPNSNSSNNNNNSSLATNQLSVWNVRLLLPPLELLLLSVQRLVDVGVLVPSSSSKRLSSSSSSLLLMSSSAWKLRQSVDVATVAAALKQSPLSTFI